MSGADHAAFVWSAYGATGAVVALLTIRAVFGYLAQRRALARLEGAAGSAGDPDG